MAKETLKVKNFGPIRDAHLELGKVTVLIGPQASGKSVLAKIMASCYSTFYLKYPPQEYLFEESRAQAPKKFLSQYEIDTLLRKESEIFLKNKNFAVCLKSLSLEHDVLNTKIIAKKKQLEQLKSEDFEKLREIQEANLRNDLDAVGRHSLEKERIVDELIRLDREIENEIGRVEHIPAERMLASLSNASQDVGLLGLKWEFFQRREYKKEFDIPILGVSYFFDRKEEKNLIRLKNGEVIDIKLAASSFQSLTPLFVMIETANPILKHLFIIEEPELNLYPSTQKRLVEYLIEKCTKGDNRLIITTHSPYILTALNNCIEASNALKASPDAKAEVDALVSPASQIDFEDVAAYFVADGTARSIMNEEYQIIDANALDDISDELSRVHNSLTDIKYQLQD